MGEWHREHPEQAAEIAALPPSERNAAERALMPDPFAAADDERKQRRERTPIRRSLEAEPRREEREEMEMDAREREAEEAVCGRAFGENMTCQRPAGHTGHCEWHAPDLSPPVAVCQKCFGRGWRKVGGDLKCCSACEGSGAP